MMRKKLSIFFSIFFLFASILMVRISCLGASPILTETAIKQQSYTLTIAKERGVIFDKNLKRLTNDESEYYAIVSPSPTVIDELGKMGTSYSREKLIELVNEAKPFICDIKNTTTNNQNILICESKKRYKTNALCPNIVGYINKDLEGVSGIEKAYNQFLNDNSHTLSAVCQVDGRGNFLSGKQVEIQAKGSADAGVVTTLDKDIEAIVEHASQNINKGAVVVLDAKTAEIRAMASFPSFSPDNPAKSLNDNEGAPMVNKALSAYPVGSTFKIATAAAAIDKGIETSREYYCSGEVDVDGQVYHCHNRGGHGNLDMAGAFKESCNPYFITLGQEVGAKALRNQAISLGYGREITLCDGIVSQAGSLPSQNMSSGQLANFSFGQGDLTASPLQIAESIFAVLNDGKVITPSLIIGTTTDGININRNENAPSIQGMSKGAANKIKGFMEETVKGTAAQPVTVDAGGKSGTAQTGKVKEDGSEDYEAWFGGFFPSQNPKYIAVVLMEGANSGTNDSGAVFSKIADQINALEG